MHHQTTVLVDRVAPRLPSALRTTEVCFRSCHSKYQYVRSIRARKVRLCSLPLLVANVRSRQNNALLDDLSSKVTALRGVTVDIYDNARDQGIIDSSVSALVGSILCNR